MKLVERRRGDVTDWTTLIPDEYFAAQTSVEHIESEKRGEAVRLIDRTHLWNRILLTQHPKVTTTGKLILSALSVFSEMQSGGNSICCSVTMPCLVQVIGQKPSAIEYAMRQLVEIGLVAVHDFDNDGEYMYFVSLRVLFGLPIHHLDNDYQRVSICKLHGAEVDEDPGEEGDE